MRAVALSRLCFGTAAPETLGALVDLAEGYADAGLWPQAGGHAARAAALLDAAAAAGDAPALARAARRADDARRAAAAARALLDLFARLERVAARDGGRVPWNDLVAALRRVECDPWGPDQTL
jgi:hypothetical protein